MDFKDQIKQLGDRVSKLKDQVLTEESTKNAFIMPFIKELGYDVFNPLEVIPEFTADLGIKNGERIDYAIIKDGNPIILIECKWHGHPLDFNNASQLFRYFHCTKAKFAILTNGIEYRFFTDLVEPNKMDEKPFLVFNITDTKDAQVEELKKFHKSYFDFEKIFNTASDLKYTNEIKQIIAQEITTPSPDFVKHFAKKVYPGLVTQKILDMFTELTKKSFSQYINDIITERLKSAIEKEDKDQKEADQKEIEEQPPVEGKIVTTEEELEGFMIVKTLIRKDVPVDKITYRDAQSYFSIFFDDNNRKPICRLYFNGNKKYIGVYNASKNEEKVEINKLEDIFNYGDQLNSIAKYYFDLTEKPEKLPKEEESLHSED